MYEEHFLTWIILISLTNVYVNCFTIQPHGMFYRETNVIRIQFINNPISPFQGYVTRNKFNRTHYDYSFNATITDYIDKKYKFGLEVQRWGDGGWKRNAITYENNDPCKQLKLTIGIMFKRIMDLLKHPANCPFQPGVYHLVNYCPSNEESYIAPVLLNVGRQRLIIQFFNKDGISINTFDMIIEIRQLN